MQTNIRSARTESRFVALGLSFLLVCTALNAASHSISGCVVDGSGHPAAHVKVLALQVGGLTTGRAETGVGDGCYRIDHLSSGKYLMSLRGDRSAPDRTGPVQAEVHLLQADLDKVNLSTVTPDPDQLRQAVSRALMSAGSGYQSEEELDDLTDPARSDNLTGVPALILPGFSQCAIHYQDGANGPTAAEWCRSAGTRDEQQANAWFARVRDAIDDAIGRAPGLRFEKLSGAGPTCAECRREIWWGSPMSGAISLRAVSSRSTVFLQLWMIYNRILAAEACLVSKKPDSDALNMAAYRVESIGIASTVENTVQQQVSEAEHTLLRSIRSGGVQEVAPTLDRGTNFPALQDETTCLTSSPAR